MGYIKEQGNITQPIKTRKWNNNTITNNILVLLFQICVITDAVIGLEPRYYVIAKFIMLVFFVSMMINLLYERTIILGNAFFLPVLFMVMTGLSCFWADYKSIAFSRFLTQIQYYILYLFCYLLFAKENISLKKYLDALYCAGIGLVLFTIYRYGWAGIIRGMSAGQRLGGAITNENVFGIVFAKAALIAYYYFLCLKDNKKHYLHILMVILFTFFSFSSGSKKAFLIILIGMLTINALEYNASRMLKLLVTSITVVVVLYLILKLPVFTTINQRLVSLFSAEKDTSDLMREKMIKLSIQLFKEKPVIGHGFNNFGMITGLGSYSHNNMTELLVSTGIIGFMIFYIPYVRMIAWSWKDGIVNNNFSAKFCFILSFVYLVIGYGMVEYYEKGYWIYIAVMMAGIDNRINYREGKIENAQLQALFK